MSTAKKRKRSSLAFSKVKFTDSPNIASFDKKDTDNGAQKNRLLPNPENVEMDEAIQLLMEKIGRLKEEEQDWKNYLKQLDEKIEEWNVFSSEIDNTNPEANRLIEQNLLSVNKQTIDNLLEEYSYPMTDLTQLAKEARNARDESYILAAVHEQSIHRLEQKCLHVSFQYNNLFEAFRKEREPRCRSPRRAVQNILNLPLTPPNT